MLIFLSFFTYHGDHRYLHSFPTRRSSDLELLLQLFREAILSESEPPRPLNARFQVRNGSLEAVSEEVFARTPSSLLEMFVILQQNPDIRGVRASTMRAVARHLWLIDEEFRQNPR